jgi:plasmid maintenance system killer protein
MTNVIPFAHDKIILLISINKQWRVCFEWHEGNAFNVEIVDYH